MLAAKVIVPKVWVPVPLAVNSPAIVTSSLNAYVTVSVAETVGTIWLAAPANVKVWALPTACVLEPSEIVNDKLPAIEEYNSFTAPITDVADMLESSVAISPKSVADKELNCVLNSSNVCEAVICLAAISF